MLYSIDNPQNCITKIPHNKDFNIWKGRLSPAEVAAIKNELIGKIDSGEVHTSSWLPGADWFGTPFFPIYEKACRRDEMSAAKCFGLFVWEVIMEHDEKWSFGRFEKNGIPIEGMTYFRINEEEIMRFP